MLRKLGVSGLVAGAVLGAVMAAAPAHAGDDYEGGQQYGQNLQGIPVQSCNLNAAVLGATVPILSPQTTGDCTNGPSGANVD